MAFFYTGWFERRRAFDPNFWSVCNALILNGYFERVKKRVKVGFLAFFV